MERLYNRWLVGVGVGILSLCLLVAGINIWNDPLFQYTDSESSRGYSIYKDATYQNPGLAKDQSYEGIITGSSMTQNFDPDYFEELMGYKFRKLSYSGGNARNITSIIDTALRNNPRVRYVVASLDGFSFMNDWTTEGNQSPEYLLNDSIFDDVSYVFNKHFLFDYTLRNIRSTEQGEQTIPAYERFTWYGFVYGDRRLTDLSQQNNELQPELDEDFYLQSARENLEHYWIPLVEKNPSVRFALFFPPYSILAWHERYVSGRLDAECRVYEEVAKTILEYPNVDVYSFQAIEPLITNLYCFKDLEHYHFRINDYITRCLVSGTNKMEKESVHKYYTEFKQFVKAFDCDFYYINPLMNTVEIQTYLDLLTDERYTTFISTVSSGEYVVDQWLVEKFNALGMCLDTETLRERDEAVVVNAGTGLLDTKDLYRGSIASIGDDKRVVFGVETIDDVKYQRMEINGVIYSPNAPGLNFVVYDNQAGRVVDSVSFSLDGTYTANRLHAWSDVPSIRQCWRDDEWMGGIENGAT